MMRLIDADALPSFIDDSQIEHFYGGVTIVHLNDLMKVVHNMPTVDAVPVVHGKWQEHHTTARGYGKIYYQHSCTPILYDSPYYYCPNCGAKMDGGKENATD